jgi:molybdate transport system substrate-binding protein
MLLSSCRGGGNERERITVFAAAGMTTAVTEIAQQYERCDVVVSFASSSTLARQIENGAPADVFISANETWMDYLVGRGFVAGGSRRDLVGNRLALVAPAGSDVNLDVGEGMDLVSALAGGKLATGDPDHVPVGMYAREALENLGLWEDVEDRLARSQSTRSALVLVEIGEAPLGIVYATDARASQKVRVLGLFPETSHGPIVFSAAIVSGRATAEVRRFFEHLTGAGLSQLFEKHGYQVLQ